MRSILSIAVLAVVVAFGLIFFHYGTVDPCRMLAKDMADDGYGQVAKAMGMEPGDTPESAFAMARMVTSQYSQKDCVMQLKDRWLGLKAEAPK
ncbi:MAG: hypothetical protein ACOH12_05345 [Parvibaculaceae bacterium]